MMLKQMDALFTASIFILITAIILVIYTNQREQEFKAHSDHMQDTVILGAAYAINLQIQNKRRHIQLFLDEYATTISKMVANPEDETTTRNIRTRLQQRFPDFYTYTITKNLGIPTLSEIDSNVGEMCQQDLQNYATRIKTQPDSFQNPIFIHPQPFHYHYDVMASMPGNKENNIFFSSFYLDEIIDILKTHEVPGQHLMLIRQSIPGLIELTRDGTRDKLKRNIRLTEEEQRSVYAYQNIPGTDWRLINLPDTDFEQRYVYSLWKEVMIILFIVSLALYLMILVMNRRPAKKT